MYKTYCESVLRSTDDAGESGQQTTPFSDKVKGFFFEIWDAVLVHNSTSPPWALHSKLVFRDTLGILKNGSMKHKPQGPLRCRGAAIDNKGTQLVGVSAGGFA